MNRIQKKDRSSQLGSLHFVFDYAKDDGFVMPPFPFFPAKAQAYDFRDIKQPDMKDGWSNVVGKSWGRVLSAVDMSKQGAYALEGSPIWGDCRIASVLGGSVSPRYTVPYTSMDNDATFALLQSFEAIYYDLPQTLTLIHPVMLAGNLGGVRYAFVLFPKAMLSQMERRNGHVLRDWFGTTWREEGEIDFGRVAIPFPFYTKGVTFADYNSFTYPEVKCIFKLNPEWTLAYALVTDSSRETLISAPDVLGGHPLMFGKSGGLHNVNLYSVTAELLQAGQAQGLWDLGLNGMAGHTDEIDDSVGANKKSLLMAFTGEWIKEEGIELLDVSMTSIPVPEGLEELPIPPPGYSYITDLSGVIYMTDKKLKTVLFPFQVFDLNRMRAEFEKVKQYLPYDPDDDSDEDYLDGRSNAHDAFVLQKQIELVEALFLHQEQVMKGNQFNYSLAKGQKP